MPAPESTYTNGLGDYLAQAGWNPREFARAINAWFDQCGQSSQRIHPTTAYSWVKRGFCPHQITADAAAVVLSHRLGCNLTAQDLWPGRGSIGPRSSQSTDELHGPWNVEHSLRYLARLVRADATQIRAIRPSDDDQVLATALDGVQHTPAPLREVTRGERVLPPMMDLIGSHIANLRRLDDLQGGGSVSLHYVNGELSTLLDLLDTSSYEPAIGQRLHLAAANLAQLAGWMHFDAGSMGAAQRYFFLGLRVGGDQLDPDARVNILGMLSYMCAHAGRTELAVDLAQTAQRLSGHATPLMRARAQQRLATAHAANGNVSKFRQHAEQARAWFDRKDQDETPASLYYLSNEQLDAENGLALVQLGASHPNQAQALWQEATTALTPLSTVDLQGSYQRSALLHGTFLAQAQRRIGDFDAAAASTALAASRLPVVQSHRCRALLRTLADDLAGDARRLARRRSSRHRAASLGACEGSTTQHALDLADPQSAAQFFATLTSALTPNSTPAEAGRR